MTMGEILNRIQLKVTRAIADAKKNPRRAKDIKAKALDEIYEQYFNIRSHNIND